MLEGTPDFQRKIDLETGKNTVLKDAHIHFTFIGGIKIL